MRIELVYMQYKISDSQELFWCSVLIILEMVSLDTLFLCSAGHQAWLCSIDRLPSKTKIGKVSWYFNNSFLCKPRFSSTTKTFIFFIKIKTKKQPLLSKWRVNAKVFSEKLHQSRKCYNFKTEFAFFIKNTQNQPLFSKWLVGKHWKKY